jgi:hypothetical protein
METEEDEVEGEKVREGGDNQYSDKHGPEGPSTPG